MPLRFRTSILTLAAVTLCATHAFAQTPPADHAAPPSATDALRLAPRNAPAADGQGQNASHLPSLTTVFGSLAAVLGAFFMLAWLMKRGMPKNMGMLPPEVVEVLGRAPLAQRQFVHLVRCGNRLLLVSVSPAGAETLSEITDPIEVDRLTGICAQQRGDSVSTSFRQVLNQFGKAKSLDELEPSSAAPGSSRRADSRSPSSTREGLHA